MNMNKGFTLIELLIVIAIIGILTSIILVNFKGVREKKEQAEQNNQSCYAIKTECSNSCLMEYEKCQTNK